MSFFKGYLGKEKKDVSEFEFNHIINHAYNVEKDNEKLRAKVGQPIPASRIEGLDERIKDLSEEKFDRAFDYSYNPTPPSKEELEALERKLEEIRKKSDRAIGLFTNMVKRIEELEKRPYPVKMPSGQIEFLFNGVPFKISELVR